jgi:polyisoprenoid-binding protein YceI
MRSMFANKFVFLLAGLGLTLAGVTWPHQQAHATQSTPPAAAPAQELVLTFDPAQTVIHWTLPATLHTVHGTFRLKHGEILLDPDSGRASGKIIVDAASGQSGNDGRDSKMHREVLESSKYSEIVFRPDRVVGNVATQGPFAVQIHGILSLHGADHDITVPVQGEFDGEHWKGAASFAVPYVKWGLKNPSTFILRVKQEVEINIETAGQLHSHEAATLPANSAVLSGGRSVSTYSAGQN